MLPWLLAAFVTVPIAEIAVFIEVGGRFGLWPTIGAVFATAVAGTWLIRQQGLSVIRDVQTELEADRFPARQLFDGLCLLVAGALLLTPGFITDTIGFLLLVPVTRNLMGAGVLRRVQVHMEAAARGDGPQPPGGGTVIIDGEFEDLTGREGGPDGPKPPPSLPKD